MPGKLAVIALAGIDKNVPAQGADCPAARSSVRPAPLGVGRYHARFVRYNASWRHLAGRELIRIVRKGLSSAAAS